MNKTGFGFLRLPQNPDGTIDYHKLTPLVDRFLSLGGSYFDTAYTYLNGLSEEAIRKSLVERHSRESFRLATKLPGYKITTPSECQQYFDRQLARCGVEYFDVYLLHWLNEANYATAVAMEEFAFLRRLKAQGKAKQIGFSYHDGPELLDRILAEQEGLDYVQLQINYLDWDSISIQARQCYQVACDHGIPIIVMEPVKGGSLMNLPKAAASLVPFPARAAIGFATSLPQVQIVLSGMNEMAQIEENMAPFSPMDQAQLQALDQAAHIIRSETAVACTGCGYCLPSCPQQIPIPKYFALYNDYRRHPAEDWKMQHAYDSLCITGGKASGCLQCRSCEQTCPQGLPISLHMADVAKAFEP